MKPRTIGLILATQLFFSCGTPSHSENTTEGMSLARLSRIDSVLHKAISSNEIPGAVALVMRHGKVVYKKSFGVANPNNQRAYENDDIFRIASMSKAITSLAVLMLWEEGKFFLDDPISKYIPEFSETKILESFNEADSSYTTVPPKNKITIRHLLTHTSGLGYGEIDGKPAMRSIYWKAGLRDIFAPPLDMKSMAIAIAQQPLHHEPGAQFTYSLGLDVLGYFVEKMSGMSYDVFLKKRVFDPLGMQDTYFTIPKEKQHRLVPVQTKNENGWEVYQSQIYDVEYPTKQKVFFSGGAGLSSTVDDYAKFLNLFAHQGRANGQQLIGKKTCELVFENQLPPNNSWHHGLAFGVLSKAELKTGLGGSEGTLTWGGYFNTSYFVDPIEKVVGVIYKQTYNIGSDSTSQRFRELVFQAIVE